VIATVLINARFLFSSGRDGVWHGVFNGALMRVHGRFDSPWVATLLAGVSATLTCFVPFHMLLVMNGTGVVVMYVLLCLGAIAGRITGASAHAAWRMPFFPVAPAFALVALVYVIWANWGDPAVGRPSLIFNLVLLALATGYFLLLRRRRGGILSMTEAAEA
jgi:amino acid transporter